MIAKKFAKNFFNSSIKIFFFFDYFYLKISSRMKKNNKIEVKIIYRYLHRNKSRAIWRVFYTEYSGCRLCSLKRRGLEGHYGFYRGQR